MAICQKQNKKSNGHSSTVWSSTLRGSNKQFNVHAENAFELIY